MKSFDIPRKKWLVSVYFRNYNKTEKLSFRLYRVIKTKDYYLAVSKVFDNFPEYKTLLGEVYKVEGDVIEELKQAIKKHASGMFLESFWIESGLERRAKIPYTFKDKFEETLEKLAEVLP